MMTVVWCQSSTAGIAIKLGSALRRDAGNWTGIVANTCHSLNAIFLSKPLLPPLKWSEAETVSRRRCFHGRSTVIISVYQQQISLQQISLWQSSKLWNGTSHLYLQERERERVKREGVRERGRERVQLTEGVQQCSSSVTIKEIYNPRTHLWKR